MKVIPYDKLAQFVDTVALEVDEPPKAVKNTFVPAGPARSVEDALAYARAGWHLDGKSQAFTDEMEYQRRAALVAAWMPATTLADQDPATREAWIWWGWTDNASPFGFVGGPPFVKVNPGVSLQTLIDSYDPSKVPSGKTE